MSELNVLRYLPGATPVHRLWAGTKALALLGIGIGAAVNPIWPAEAVLAALVGLALVLARVPWSARPRVPAWLVWLWLGVGAVLALVAGGSPALRVGGLRIGVGGLDIWARFVVLAGLILLSVALLTWTTPMAELAPALARLGRPLTRGPLARLRLPVDDLVTVLALGVRCLPLLMDEVRMLLVARRARGRPRRRGLGPAFDEGVDLLVATLVVAVRRAGEMGEAMEARGGLPARLPIGRPPGRADLVALLVVAAAVAGMILA